MNDRLHLPALLAVCLISCTERQSPVAVDVGIHDGVSAPDTSQPPILPWVSRYAGTGGCTYSTAGVTPRLLSGLDYVRALRYDAERGLLVGTSNGQVLEIRDNDLHWISGGFSGNDVIDGPVGEAGFRTVTDLLYERGRHWVAETSVLRVIEDGVVRTVSGDAKEWEVVDGKGAVARFEDIRSLLHDQDRLIVSDSLYIRTYDPASQIVNTIAGNGKVPSRDVLPPEGPALEVPVSASDMAVTSEGLLFSMGHQLGVLSDGLVTTIARSVWTDVPGLAEDGEVGTAIFSVGDFEIQGARLYFVHFDDYLRVLEDDHISSLSSRETGLQEDGPLSQFQFTKIMSMTADPDGNLYIGDRCTIWRVQLR